jgi:prepilin-type N-terminal cleavage/methylation domain-containing protein
MGAAALAFGNRKTRAAFTMIELMVVVGIMGVILAAGIPTIYSAFNKNPMRETIRDVVEVCSNARARAIMSGTVTQVTFNGADGTYSASSVAAPAPVLSQDEMGQIPAQITAPPPSSSQKTASRFPDSVAISKLLVNGVDGMELTQVRVRFFPNGTCDDLILQLQSENNERVEITLELTTGLALVKHDWREFRLK